MFDYGEMREMAEGLLQEFGTDAVIVKPGTASGAEHRPEIGQPNRHLVVVARVSKNYTPVEDARLTLVKNRYLISTETGVKPETGDSVEFQNRVELIQSVREIGPAGLTVLWIVNVGDV